MPPETAHLTPRQKRELKAARARKILSGANPRRDDSGDEESDSSDDDGDWEWIYEARPEEDQSAGEGSEDDGLTTTPRKRPRRATRHSVENVIGARKRGLTCKIGDTVLVENGTATDWVAMISQFDENHKGGKIIHLLWFNDSLSILNKAKRRTDFLPNELYITPESDTISMQTINGHATVMSEKEFNTKYPKGVIPKKSKDFGRVFICRRGVNTKTAIYSEEIVWEDLEHTTEEEIHILKDFLDEATRGKKKRKYEKRIKADDDFKSGPVDDDQMEKEVGTPRKRRKSSALSTPRKPKTPSKLLTPSHKRVIIKKPLEFTPLGTRVLDPDHVYSSPFQTARSRLHVSAVPASLPCREDEFTSVYSHLEAAIYEGTGACIYISGTPGTGKTATVREVVAQLNASVQAEELDDFIFVEINGMKVTDPHQSYSLLWEALKGDRVSPSHALDLLEREFNNPSPRRVPCVVLMDELDQLVTKNQSVMYNFFNWPGLRHSRLIVLAVANTMDLPERTLSNKISSRLGLTRITFPGYTHEQLVRIIQTRLEGVPGNIVDPDAITFASKKVAAVSGDARRALDICRRAVELAESESLTVPNTPSKSADGNAGNKVGKGIVTIATVRKAINEATTSPLQQYLRALPLSSKILLAALSARTRRTGIGESVLGEVVDEAKRMAKMDTARSGVELLLKNELMVGKSVNLHWLAKPLASSKTAPRLLGMGSSAIELMDAGVIGLETKKADRVGKVRLCIGEEDVKLAFKDDPEIKGFGF